MSDLRSKSKRYCSVPNCNTYASPSVSLHYFPKDSYYRKQWQVKLKIGKPITKFLNVCSQHFRAEDYKTREKSAKPQLKKEAVPSLKLPAGIHDRIRQPRRQIQRRSGPPLRDPVEERPNLLFNNDDNEGVVEDVTVTAPVANMMNNLPMFIDVATQTDFPPYFLDNDKKLKSFTSIDSNIIDALEKCVSNVTTENKEIFSDIRIRILLVLVKLKLNVPFTCLAILFSISESTCTRYFTSTLKFLARAVESVIYWPTKEENLNNMPKCFEQFRNTRVVLDCTEIAVQKCKCLKCRIVSYSHYKGTNTLKFLIGVTPSGLISYKSPGYGGRTSDKAIFNKEDVISRLEPYEAIMVDKGFLIERECENNLVSLIRPPFLSKKAQLSKEDAERTANIARARVHVERAIQRIKSYKILNEQIKWHMLSNIDDIVTIICALVNLSAPILSDQRF